MADEGGGEQTKGDKPTKLPAATDNLEEIASVSDRLWRIAKLGVALAVLGFIAVEVWHECSDDGVVLEPVVINVPTTEGAPTKEMAAQQITSLLGEMAHTGAHEWKQFQLDQEAPEVAIQLPGSSISLDAVVRAIASLFPNRRRILQVSITPGEGAKRYVAAITTTVGQATTSATCEAIDPPPNGSLLSPMFECLALEAMKAINILFGATHLLAAERQDCKLAKVASVDGSTPPATQLTVVQASVQSLRDHCAFLQTRTLVAAMVKRGRQDELPWVPYIYAQVHLARGDALAVSSYEGRIYEQERAISRFQDVSQGNRISASALAIEMSARIDEAVTIHERATRAGKDGEQKRRMRAEKILGDVDHDLQRSGGGRGFARVGRAFPGVSDNSQKSTLDAQPTCEPTGGPPVDHNNLNSLVFALEGLVKYRQYLLKKDESPQVVGQESLLSQAVANSATLTGLAIATSASC
jgi:hypothetical protein